MKRYIKASDLEDEAIEQIAQDYTGWVSVEENRYHTASNEIAHKLQDEMLSLSLNHDYIITVQHEFVCAERADGGKIEGSDYDKLEPIAERDYGPRDYNRFSQTRDDYKNRKADALFVSTHIHYNHMD